VAIRPPVAARFARQTGRNLLVLCREEGAGLGVMACCLLSLLAQTSSRTARCYVADFAASDAAWSAQLGELAPRFPEQVTLVGRRALPGVLGTLCAELARRVSEDAMGEPARLLIVQGLHRARDLRGSDDGFDTNDSAEQFLKLLREGPEYGMHVLAWADVLASVTRVDRRAPREFGLRLAGPMSKAESQDFLESEAAGVLDRPHRMVFADDDRPGAVEKLRPYALPDETWLQPFLARLVARAEA
jgi:hypothetical protein